MALKPIPFQVRKVLLKPKALIGRSVFSVGCNEEYFFHRIRLMAANVKKKIGKEIVISSCTLRINYVNRGNF